MMVKIISEIKHAYPNHAACTGKWCTSSLPAVGAAPKVWPVVCGARSHRRVPSAARRDANVSEAGTLVDVIHHNPKLAAP